MLLDRSGAARRRRRPRTPPATNGERSHPPADVIMITSAGTDDGKTTTVANLAAAYGESGQSVLVLSFDLQRSAVRPSRTSATRASATTSPPTSPPRSRPSSGTRGARRPGRRQRQRRRPPGGQFAAQQRLLDEARALADVVIIDTAPLLASSIGRELATMVDRVVVLCRVGRTTVGRGRAVRRPARPARRPRPRRRARRRRRARGSEYFGYFTCAGIGAPWPRREGDRGRDDGGTAGRPPARPTPTEVVRRRVRLRTTAERGGARAMR